ncbi:unnamed protein product [Amoebophrya sp. A120]|nr:unnamed protein product [Amoebophrya sp. A120]|eukprot:GSA120T00004655001.1
MQNYRVEQRYKMQTHLILVRSVIAHEVMAQGLIMTSNSSCHRDVC